MADSRFEEMICEITGVKSPADIKREELAKLVREHFSDAVEEPRREAPVAIHEDHDDELRRLIERWGCG